MINAMVKRVIVVICISMSAPITVFASNEKISTRIVGGTQSVETQWPFMVSLKVKTTNEHFCGASLIADNWVLTAAHCVMNEQNRLVNPTEITSTIGEYNIFVAKHNIDIEAAYVHPDYNAVSSNNDIALLKLTEKVNEIPISIVDFPSTASYIEQQYNVTAIGWGSTTAYIAGQTVTPDYPNLLRQVELPLLSIDQCQVLLGSAFTDNMICAGLVEGGKDTCQGDSGGPLLINSNSGWQQIGIASWGYGCAAANNPGVYTRLANYASWLETITHTNTITTLTTFAKTAINSVITKLITINNDSATQAHFSYQLTGSNTFTFDASLCETIDAESSCQFSVTYAPLLVQTDNATIWVNSDILNAPQLSANLLGTTQLNITALVANLGWPLDNGQWFTGGDQQWQLDEAKNQLLSGDIEDNQTSILVLKVNGKGSLQFDWSSSSEFNFDIATLTINNVLMKSLSGSRVQNANRYFLDQASNEIIWTYQKDSSKSDFDDNMSVKNVIFKNMTKWQYEQQQAEETVVPLVEKVNSSGAGSFGLLSLLLLSLLLAYRRVEKHSAH